LLTPAGVVDFIAIQRADGAGIVLNVADVAAYAGVVMLMRTAALVIAAIRRNRESAAAMVRGEQRTTAITRLSDLEVVRAVSRDDAKPASEGNDRAPSAPRPVGDRQVHLRIIHADGAPRRGASLAARLRDPAAASRAPGSAYLRPMSHPPEASGQR
jgi:hypothetical protein